MTPKPKRSAHAGLERHNQNLAEATSALHEAETAEREADEAVETARAAVREAFDLGADAAEATAALDQRKQDAEAAKLRREGIEQRVRRAAARRETFLAENAEELITELLPACEQAVEDLRTHAAELLEADRRWRELSTVVASHLRALKLTPHQNAPGVHGLEGILLGLKRTLQNEEINSPGPHWGAKRAARKEHERVIAMRAEREGAAA